MNYFKACIKFQKNGGFLTILPPKTAVHGGEIIIFRKYLQLAFQNCFYNFPGPKIKGVMIFKKKFIKIRKTAVS